MSRPLVAKPLDPATRFVRSLDGEYYMVREAADLIGVSDRTLRRLIVQTKDNPDPADRMAPSFKALFGQIEIYLYTRDDIEKISRFLRKRQVVFPLADLPETKTGRPRRWTPEERKTRNRLYSRIAYHRKRAEELASKGDDAQSALHRDEITQTEAQLAEMETKS